MSQSVYSIVLSELPPLSSSSAASTEDLVRSLTMLLLNFDRQPPTDPNPWNVLRQRLDPYFAGTPLGAEVRSYISKRAAQYVAA